MANITPQMAPKPTPTPAPAPVEKLQPVPEYLQPVPEYKIDPTRRWGVQPPAPEKREEVVEEKNVA